ncbi:hypothetical protein AOXY_G34707 [Acipenser oxyrinchus oxyrinchus]|uniref:Uncharacterized protein n=1 Tax=Acipenser oxyrinchus oxyrinchus TaxID=40147 RepID=A0AAD8CGF0_ACIOX|nr:hypothetical protein AOXY_G34707 [Acipenser oxyrinchus oxyrinchus]
MITCYPQTRHSPPRFRGAIDPTPFANPGYLLSYSNQTFKPRRSVIGRLIVTRCAGALPCSSRSVNVRLAGSFSSSTNWILCTLNYEPFSSFGRQIPDHGRQEKPNKAKKTSQTCGRRRLLGL